MGTQQPEKVIKTFEALVVEEVQLEARLREVRELKKASIRDMARAMSRAEETPIVTFPKRTTPAGVLALTPAELNAVDTHVISSSARKGALDIFTKGSGMWTSERLVKETGISLPAAQQRLSRAVEEKILARYGKRGEYIPWADAPFLAKLDSATQEEPRKAQ